MGTKSRTRRMSPGQARIRKLLTGDRTSLRTRIAVIVVLLVASTLLSLQCNPSVGSKKVPGLVLEIDAVGIPSLNEGPLQSRVLIAVGDSAETHIMLPPPVPKPGHFIPLEAEYFRKGNVEYTLDMKKWLTEGPS